VNHPLDNVGELRVLADSVETDVSDQLDETTLDHRRGPVDRIGDGSRKDRVISAHVVAVMVARERAVVMGQVAFIDWQLVIDNHR
jgi:hypothetical protein